MNEKTTHYRVRMLKIAACVIGLALLVWFGIRFAETVRVCSTLDKNPQEFGASMVYMTIKGKDILIQGVWTTIRIALLGTGIAFVLELHGIALAAALSNGPPAASQGSMCSSSAAPP